MRNCRCVFVLPYVDVSRVGCALRYSALCCMVWLSACALLVGGLLLRAGGWCVCVCALLGVVVLDWQLCCLA